MRFIDDRNVNDIQRDQYKSDGGNRNKGNLKRDLSRIQAPKSKKYRSALPRIEVSLLKRDLLE